MDFCMNLHSPSTTHARGMVLDAARMLSKRRGGPYRAIVMRVRNTLPHGRS